MGNRFRTVEQTVDSWAFWGLVGRLGAGVAGLLFWFGLIEVTPYSLFSGFLHSALPGQAGAEPSVFLELADHFLGGIFWFFAAALWMEYVRYRVGVLEAGSKEAYRLQRREAAQKAAMPAPVGALVSITPVKGGLLSSSETQVETSEGYFRVSGLVEGVKKGEPVFTLHGYLLVGEGDRQRRFTRCV